MPDYNQSSFRRVNLIIGSNIRAKRIEAGQSAVECAALVEIKVGRFAAIEAGGLRPSAAELFEIAQALGSTIREVFEGVGGS